MTTHAVSTTPPLAGTALVGSVNAALALLATANQSASAPTSATTGLTSMAGFVWHDTTAGLLKIRDQADTVWIVAGYFDEIGKTFTPHINPAQFYAADTGTANHYVVAPLPAWPTYAAGGPIIAFMAGHANDGVTAPDLTVSGIAGGAKLIVRQDGSTPLKGDILTTSLTVCVWNQAAGNFALLTQKATPLAFIKGTFSNLTAISGTGTKATNIVADAAVLLDSSNNPYVATAVALTPLLSSSGALGLDTGAVAASTWYSTWLIWNGTTLSALYSLSATAPTMPSGYTYKVRTGWVKTDGSSNIISYFQAGRRVRYINQGSGLPLMQHGAAGSSISVPTWVNVSTAPVIPSTATAIDVLLYADNVVIAAAPSNQYGAYNSYLNPPPLMLQPPTSNKESVIGTFLMEQGSWQSLSYFCNDPGTVRSGMFCAGWEDNL